jgi:hypothetical protein
MAIEETWGKPAPGIEDFFELHGKVIREFASYHNLIISKYYHNIDGWELIFQHPKGGACYIDVIKKNNHHVSLLAVWWIDDWQINRRCTKHIDKIESFVDKTVLADNLEKLFRQILSWEKEDLDTSGKPFQPLKKEDIDADLARYPVPTNIE